MFYIFLFNHFFFFLYITVCIKWKEAIELCWCEVDTCDDCNYDNYKKILTVCGKYLKYLKVTKTCFSQQILSKVSKICSNLIHLEVDLFYFIPKRGSLIFMEKFDKLKSITLHNYKIELTDASWQGSFVEFLPVGIENIYVHGNKKSYYIEFINVSFNFIFYSFYFILFYYCLFIYLQTFEKFKSLRRVTLSRLIVDNAPLKSLRKNKETLINLNLNSCDLGTRGQLYISKLINLECLNLRGTNINDDTMIKITENCKKLKQLNISDCKYLTKKCLKKIVKFKNINELMVNNLRDIDDSIIGQFVNLKILECNNCINVTDNSVIKIVEKSPNLVKLCLNGTGITCRSYFFLIIKVRDVNSNLDTIYIDEKIKRDYYKKIKNEVSGLKYSRSLSL